MKHKMGIISGHPVLNSNSRQMALALSEAGLLDEFHTTLDTSRIAGLLPAGKAKIAMDRRALPAKVHERTRTHPFPEFVRLARRSLPRLSNPKVFAPDSVLHDIDRHMSLALRAESLAVYAYEDGALASFTRASDMGIGRLYDLPIGYWRAAEHILRDEIEREPRWASTIPMSTVVNHSERMERKDAEISKASAIIVASTFTAKTLELYPGICPPVTKITYGSPPAAPERARSTSKNLRVLYVGSLTQRKGISYLFDAVSAFGQHVELTVIGRQVTESPSVDAALSAQNVTWIKSADHAAVLKLMRNHDLLAFPSLFEGFGLVLTEALSQGLPVLATGNTGAPDIISSGKEGWIIPVRSSQAIAEKLELLLDQPALRWDMSHAATTRSRHLTWDTYRTRLATWAREASRG